jgi:hypothetical protein
MPRGGARPNSGPKKGTVYRRKLTLREGELEQLRQEARTGPGAKRVKDQMAEYATLVGLLALEYQPMRTPDGNVRRGEDGLPMWPPGAEEQFSKYMQLFGYLAGKAAPYQSPTFKAIHLAIDAPPEEQTRVINLRIFEDTGTAAGLMEAHEDLPERWVPVPED